MRSPEECFAWEEFYVRFDVVIRDSIATIHKAQDVIDDVAQDAWITLIKKLPRWAFNPAIGSIDAWLRKIARRLAAKCARRGSKRRAGSLSEIRADGLVDPEPGPDIEIERMQEHELFGSLVLEFAASVAPARWPDRRLVLVGGVFLVEDLVRAEHDRGCRVVGLVPSQAKAPRLSAPVELELTAKEEIRKKMKN